MLVQLKLFATYREIVGEGQLPWTAAEGTRLGDLVDAILRKYPRLAAHRSSMLVAVNLAVAGPDVVLHEGDEVALLPPVSGGGP